MPDESGEIQNSSVGSDATSESQVVGNNPDSSQEEDTSSQGVDDSQEQTDDSNKKERDFEKGLKKWREIAKSLRAENEALKQRSNLTSSTEGSDEDENEGAWQKMQGMMREELSPITAELESLRRDRVLDEIGQLPYSQELAPEIKEEYDNLGKSFSGLPFSEKMEIARERAIAKNIDKITSVMREVGKSEAYKNQSAKKKQMGLGEQPTSAQQSEDLLERLASGKMSTEEYRSKRTEIEALERKRLGLV